MKTNKSWKILRITSDDPRLSESDSRGLKELCLLPLVTEVLTAESGDSLGSFLEAIRSREAETRTSAEWSYNRTMAAITYVDAYVYVSDVILNDQGQWEVKS